MFLGREHWAYVWVPFLGALVWFGTLLAMLIVWLAQGQPRLPSQDESIAFISDIGADILKPLFITGCSITATAFVVSLAIERWLRHSGRLLPTMRKREQVFSSLSISSAFIGGIGLILLSILDTRRFTSEHRAFLLVFIVGVALSAIFTIVEYRWLSRDFIYASHLRIAYMAKAIIAGVLIILAIVFAVTLYKAKNVGAVIEWVIGFGFTFYIITLFFDLRVSKGKQRGELSKPRFLSSGTLREVYGLRIFSKTGQAGEVAV
ncbi:hypothetical protein M378DRAFT_185555 [Amanita muscaria Koide BX008]|uniref:CWH43-like N-terminal domain-containing protein n=1 Tax=Amanita muscaria (strain Koide BX008) TaxID=946122 RepID=A0A0C2XF39_AMAMK|nr:hypothetical protein M378DRAFT_185555 [Amanita muscaria Koide BX008]